MTVIALASAKHSPGVTTTMLALATAWPDDHEVLIAELDPAGGDLAPRLGLSLEPGLTSLATASRHTGVDIDTNAHTQPVGPGVHALVGPTAADEATAALSTLSPRMRNAFGAGDAMAVLADCGRLTGAKGGHEALGVADLVLLVVRPDLASVEHARTRLGHLQSIAGQVMLVVIGDRPYSPREVAESLQTPLLGCLADDPVGASCLWARDARRLSRSTLLRSARVVAEGLAALLETIARGDDLIVAAAGVHT
jgi:MinD-like ATPase involved in chromosome partitioning or flagellar assembly